MSQEMKKVAEVEGITQYELDNGLTVLIFPDDSRPTVTVSLTVFVGSRHEGYGEAGMAHLLEHMLFKGTPAHPDIPKVLQDRGARFNGTTSTDRTNYYETLPASSENLEFAIRLEADRMINSFIRGEDLASEMTVVRNEFERGENSPYRILMQRMESAAYDWHNYGQSTIGNRSDIERVPLPNLRRFYSKYYQPDNAMLVVAGRFDRSEALSLIKKYFGSVERPERQLDRTYTIEPAKDGERSVTLRRVGDFGLAGVAYHVPAGGHPEFAAVQVLSYVLAMEPGGRLYKSMVETKKAASVTGFASPQFDPGLMMMFAEVSDEKSLDEVGELLIATVEGVGSSDVTEDEVERAKRQILNRWEQTITDSSRVAVALSNWAAQGDWRLLFLYRDRVEQVTPTDVKEVASKYLVRPNRTFGLFFPAETSARVEVSRDMNLADALKDYQGRGAVAAGEEFDATPENIERRTERGRLPGGTTYALLPKKTRGQSVNLLLTLRYGDVDNLKGFNGAAELLPTLMTRGTKRLSHQRIQDELDKNNATLQARGQLGSVTFRIQTKRDNLPDVLQILKQVLREPLLDEEQLELHRREQVVAYEQVLNDPRSLASNRLRQILSPYPEGDVRHVPDLPGQLDWIRDATREQVVTLHSKYLGGEHGQVSVVGDFDADQTKTALADMLGSWTSEMTHQRIPSEAFLDVPGQQQRIETPDKANAAYYAGLTMALKDSDTVYAPLVIGDFVLGGGSLSSRLGDRVRQKEGLSYGVGSGIQASSFDDVGRLTVAAIANPENTPKLVAVVQEELDRLIRDGISDEELERAKQGYLQAQSVRRTDDGQLAALLSSTLYADRTMKYYTDLEDRISKLDRETVNQALKQYVPLNRLVVVTAGDFREPAASSP